MIWFPIMSNNYLKNYRIQTLIWKDYAHTWTSLNWKTRHFCSMNKNNATILIFVILRTVNFSDFRYSQPLYQTKVCNLVRRPVQHQLPIHSSAQSMGPLCVFRSSGHRIKTGQTWRLQRRARNRMVMAFIRAIALYQTFLTTPRIIF